MNQYSEIPTNHSFIPASVNRFATKNLLIKAAIVVSLAVGLSRADTTNDDDMIITSKPHNLPRLMTLQTSEVLESYGIGFAGSGNIQSIVKGSPNAMNGAVYLGLGDVAELGYDMEQIRMNGEVYDNRMKGHVKIQPIAEGKYMPAIAVTYGTSINDGVTSVGVDPFGLERQSWIIGASKSFSMGSYRVSMHPGVTMNLDKVTRLHGESVDSLGLSSHRLGAQFGATWQTAENTMFMYESRVVSILDQKQVQDGILNYQYGFENNLGVRFYLRNWLFLDAGILTMYDAGDSKWDTGIHANISGLIPLKSVAERIFGK